jgi:hypothetical protein
MTMMMVDGRCDDEPKPASTARMLEGGLASAAISFAFRVFFVKRWASITKIDSVYWLKRDLNISTLYNAQKVGSDL